ncbi:MAG: bifunctional UDP-N-acetylglucosamine pyrophosphorylase / glucosamine-phosphate N-acetyltransferase [Clostridia bacterium]|nr:bifunctional UDP-N-acetylglucosamine pyrophosphorylase / glucosamine-phosphate N-acetyltransferase [Clostridia bacterium]
MPEVAAVILAAGKGKRMHSDIPKVLHQVAGKPMVKHVLEAAEAAGINKNIIVVGHEAQLVVDTLGRQNIYVLQEQQLGTGHALAQAREKASSVATVLVLCGDTPLIKSQTLEKLLQHHQKKEAAVTILTSRVDNPTGYGRIIRDVEGKIKGIVEERDASEEQKLINEINTGIYCFDTSYLWTFLEQLKPDNDQGEYYLTDVVAMCCQHNLITESVVTNEPEEVLGVNNRAQLAIAGQILRERINNKLMLSGVTIIDPETTYIDSTVIIGSDTVIYPNTFIEGNTTISSHCQLGPGTTIRDSKVDTGCKIINSVVLESEIGSDCEIGPFAYLRPGTVLQKEVKVGDFVEIKASIVGTGSKIPHLSYIGDADIGKKVNIGAGTITCNYDGNKKWPTQIGDGAFIGSNANLVAPVKVGGGALVGAGSTITKDVPSNSLAIAREKQKNLSRKK